MFLAFWHYLRGYVIIKVIGFSTERFMNLASMKGVFLWDIRHEGTGVTMKVSIKEFRELKDCGRRTKCKITILQKKGLPFTIGHSKRHKLYTAGIFAFIIVLYIMSSFVWNVTVSGNERVSTEKILDFCHEEGLYIGQIKYKLDNKSLTKRMIANFSDISWVAITTKGTDVTIAVVETIPQIAVEDKEQAVSLVSSKACIIESISVSRGTPMVKAGDVVDVGDLLVTGEIAIMDMENRVGGKYVHSKAEIKGKSLVIKENQSPLCFMKKEYTGQRKTDKSLIVGNYVINIISPNVAEAWEEKSKTEKIFKAGGTTLPFRIVTQTFLQYNEVEKKRTEEEANRLLNLLIDKQRQELEFNGAQVINTETEFYTENEAVNSKTTFTVIEEVGIEQKIEEKGDTDINE